MEKGYIEIGSVLVDPRIFETPYLCDVKGYRCGSICCHRGCIIRPSEIKRIEAHLSSILPYLSIENREAIKRNGSFVAQCPVQCPEGCDIHPEEAKAVRRFFKEDLDFRCTLLFNDLCVFIYTNHEGLKYCAIHSYALDNRMKVEDIKKIDCIQYPLMVYRRNGKKVLALQEVPYLSHIPCMNDRKGEPMYRGLQAVVGVLLGKEFNRKLQAYGKTYRVGHHQQKNYLARCNPELFASSDPFALCHPEPFASCHSEGVPIKSGRLKNLAQNDR